MKKILFLTSRLPYPPDRGDKVRSHQFLNVLSSKYDVIPVSLYGLGDRRYVKEFTEAYPKARLFYQSPLRMGLNLLLGLFSKRPLQVIIYRNPKMKRAIQGLIQEDNPTIYAFLIRMIEYVQDIKDCYRIADLTDCISMEYERRLNYLKWIHRFIYAFEAKRLRELEQSVSALCDESWFISAIDRKTLGLETSNCHVIPNSTKLYPHQKDYRYYGKMMFVGRMSVAHNIHSVQYVRDNLLDTILAKYPKLTFDIVGACPPKIIRNMDGSKNTKVHGFVDDLLGALAECDVFVAPMFFSAGMQNKVLEAMAVGVPVVMTENVAESIGCRDKVHYLKAGNKDEFIARIFELLEDAELRAKIGTAAKQFISQHYSPEIVSSLIYSRFDSVSKA